LPVLMIVRNSSNVWSPSGSPVFVEGVKLRAIMWGACGVPRGELIIVPNTSAAHTRVAPIAKNFYTDFTGILLSGLPPKASKYARIIVPGGKIAVYSVPMIWLDQLPISIDCVGKSEGFVPEFPLAGSQHHAFCIPIRSCAFSPLIQGGSRMRRSACTDLCGGGQRLIVPTATLSSFSPPSPLQFPSVH